MAQQPSLLRHAILEPLHLIALVVMVVFITVFLSFPPLIEWGGLLLLELAYLFGFARTPAYARRVNVQHGQALLANQEEDIAQRAAGLRMEDRRRYQAIQKLYGEVLKRLEETGSGTGLSLDQKRLMELRDAALEFSLAHQRFREHLTKTDLSQLEAQLAASNGTSEAERTTRGLLQQRVEGLRQMKAEQTHLDEQLTVIEQTFQLMKEQLSTLNMGNVRLPADVTQLTQDIEATRRTLAEMNMLERQMGP